MEERGAEGRLSDLVVCALAHLGGAGEGVGLADEPVHVAVAVQGAGQAAVGAPAHLASRT